MTTAINWLKAGLGENLDLPPAERGSPLLAGVNATLQQDAYDGFSHMIFPRQPVNWAYTDCLPNHPNPLF
jgi:hypothetical protein